MKTILSKGRNLEATPTRLEATLTVGQRAEDPMHGCLGSAYQYML